MCDDYFLVIKMINGWEIRDARYEDIHKIDQKDFEQLVKTLEIKQGDVIADLMSGYGAATREILKYCRNIKPILVDMSEKQLDRSKKELGTNLVERILADVKYCPLKDGSVDKVVIKMGLHEVPQNDQQTVIDQSYRILKQEGILAIWHMMLYTREEQKLFQDILREKDRLAGLDSLIVNRYFYRKDEIETYLDNAGFRDTKLFCEMDFDLAAEKRLHGEFNGDEDKLMSWMDYIRKRVPRELKSKTRYIDQGRIIKMTFRQEIIKSTKF